MTNVDPARIRARGLDAWRTQFDPPIGRTTAFKLVREGKLIVRKVGARAFVFDEDNERFLAGLPTKRRAA